MNNPPPAYDAPPAYEVEGQQQQIPMTYTQAVPLEVDPPQFIQVAKQ